MISHQSGIGLRVLSVRDGSNFFFMWVTYHSTMYWKSILSSLISNATLSFVHFSSIYGSVCWILLYPTGQLLPIFQYLSIRAPWSAPVLFPCKFFFSFFCLFVLATVGTFHIHIHFRIGLSSYRLKHVLLWEGEFKLNP